MKNNLKSLRKKKMITQEQLANMINVSRDTYRNYETGRNEPTLETLVKIANILDASTDEILMTNSKVIVLSEKDYKELQEAKKILERVIK